MISTSPNEGPRPPDDPRPAAGELTEAELDGMLMAADSELLEYVKATAHPEAGLLAIMAAADGAGPARRVCARAGAAHVARILDDAKETAPPTASPEEVPTTAAELTICVEPYETAPLAAAEAPTTAAELIGQQGTTEDKRARSSGAVRVVLRPMGRADVSAVAAMEEALFGAEAWSPELLATEVTADPVSRYYLVAEDNGVITGYGGLLAQRGGQADVLTLAVAKHRWGEGIGTALLDGLLTEAARRGCIEVFLEVRADNDRAQRLYRRRGFTGIGIRRAYYQPSGTDALVMRLVQDSPAAGNRRPTGRHGEERVKAMSLLDIET